MYIHNFYHTGHTDSSVTEYNISFNEIKEIEYIKLLEDNDILNPEDYVSLNNCEQLA